MKLHDIAVNNLRRRKGKVFFLVMGLLVGVAAVVALHTTTTILEEDIAHKMDEFGANIIVTPKSEGLSLTYGGLSLGGLSFDMKEISEADLEKIRTIENAANIRIVSPKVFGVFEKEGHKALVVGVDFNEELSLKKWWKITGDAPEKPNQILLGKEAAEWFQASPVPLLEIKGEPFKVAGVLESTGSQDDGLVFMNLPTSQKLFGKQGTIGMIEIAALCKNCPISEIVSQLSDKLPSAKVTAVQQVVEGRMDTLHSFRKFSLGISALVLLVGSMVVFVTMMASVNERTREIGIFSAIGFRRSHIMKIILLEAAAVSLMAGLTGYLMGIGVTRLLLTFLTDHMPKFNLDPLVALGAVFLAVLVGLLASLYPALTASRMDPSEALRTL
ncbi:MAG: ABC transporter permease [Desulfomonile tiedjei]|uniref:ABC transporter permease n=1 Tax=Desulfomonile tiedjei TaxID=2358 RepID=A0A9D6V621_9BACT|nr:ABC transporter permease [Desulfomonile tiedjei]